MSTSTAALRPARRPRSATRTLGLAAVAAATAVVVSPAAAWAVPAEGWPAAPDISALRLVVTLVLIPLGLAVVLGVAFALPGLAASRSASTSTLPATWMGGPKEGTSTLPEGSSASDDTGSDARGGSSARW